MTLRRRLLLLVLGLTASGLVTAGVVSVFLLRSYVLGRVDRQLENFASSPTGGPLQQGPGGRLTCPRDGQRPFLGRQNPDGIVSQAYVDGAPYCAQQFQNDPGGGPRLTGDDLKRQGKFTATGVVAGHDYRVQVRNTGGLTVAENGVVTNTDATLSVVYAIDLGDAKTTWKNQALATGIVGATTLLLLGGAALLLVRRDLRPLERVTSAAEEIARGDLSLRVEIPASASEVGRLGTAFNTMVSSIETAFGEQQRSEQKLRQFVADASHELRTPLTSIRGYAELERVGGADTPDKRATVMRHIEREATRMTGLVEDLRQIKDSDEIDELRLAVRQAEQGFALMKSMLVDGMTERQAAHELEHGMRRFGALRAAFEPIIGVGDHSALPHYRAGLRRFDESPFVLCDWGALSPKGYHSDLTRVWATGKVSPKLLRIYGVVLKAQQAAIAAIRPGVKCQEVDAVARKIIDQAGYAKYFGHGLGHGIGLDIHEGPRFSPISTDELKPGMVVTVEPGIYLPGIGGVRIEDDVLVTRDGCEVLTSVSRDLGLSRELGGVNS